MEDDDVLIRWPAGHWTHWTQWTGDGWPRVIYETTQGAKSRMTWPTTRFERRNFAELCIITRMSKMVTSLSRWFQCLVGLLNVKGHMFYILSCALDDSCVLVCGMYTETTAPRGGRKSKLVTWVLNFINTVYEMCACRRIQCCQLFCPHIYIYIYIYIYIMRRTSSTCIFWLSWVHVTCHMSSHLCDELVIVIDLVDLYRVLPEMFEHA